jgi:hypothetical protein
VHAHVWNADEFFDVIRYAADEMGIRWEVVDTMRPGDEGTYGDEFGWVLSKMTDQTRARARFRAFRKKAH